MVDYAVKVDCATSSTRRTCHDPSCVSWPTVPSLMLLELGVKMAPFKCQMCVLSLTGISMTDGIATVRAVRYE